MTAADAAAPPAPRTNRQRHREGFGSLGSILHLLALVWAAGIASFPLNDNSFFTHLATGRLILDRGSVPTADPYTFTAMGEPWTVQSWLASVAYASAEQLGGAVGLRLLILTVFAGAMTVLWRLSAPASSVIARLFVVTLALFVVTDLWSERPYMAGVIGLGVVWLALEGRVPPPVLVPVLWLWANVHGSFPLAGVLAVLVLGGAALDRRTLDPPLAPARAALRVELSVLRWIAIGSLLAAVSPLGLDVLWFPLKAVTQSAALATIVEWNPPLFDSIAERAFLVLFLVAVAAVSRLGSWRRTLPVLVFGGAAIFAQRNVVMAVMVLVPVIAEAAPSLGSLRSTTRPTLGHVVAAVAGLLVVAVGAAATVAPVTAFGGYPARAIAWSSARDGAGRGPDLFGSGPDRMAVEDFTGNLLELLDGPTGTVFVDDRADMFPSAVFGDYVSLVQGATNWDEILDRYDIHSVTWRRDRSLSIVLAASPQWRVLYADTAWIVACRRGSC